MRQVLTLVLLFCGCVFAQELSTVDVSKFPTDIVRKTGTPTVGNLPKFSASNTIIDSGFTDDGTNISTTEGIQQKVSTVVTGRLAVRGAVTAVATTRRSRTGNIATITTAAHGLVPGCWVTITGMTDTSFNVGPVQLLATTSTTFTFVLVGADVADGADVGGTVTPSDLKPCQITKGVSPTQTASAQNGTTIKLDGSSAMPSSTPNTPGNASGGDVRLNAGKSSGTTAGGSIILTPGKSDTGTAGNVEIDQNAIAATSTDGLVLANNTAATVGVPAQQSPRLRLRSNVWNTDGSNDTHDWWFEQIPTSAATTTSTLYLYTSKNGAAGTSVFNVLSSPASVSVTGALGATSYVSTGTDFFLPAASRPATGTMTAVTIGTLKTIWSKWTWTNAMVVAGGAVTSFDVSVATLPAKTRVVHAYIVVSTSATNMGAATVTAQLGTDATFSNFLNAASMTAAANTVYGDADAEMGGSLPPTVHVGFMPSWTTTTAVKVRFTTDGAGGKTLADLLTCTGSVYLLTETLP